MKNKGIWFLCLAFALVVTGIVNGCGNRSQSAETKTFKSRLEAIPSSAVKVTPVTDLIPPVLHSSDFREPVPLGEGVNTAGAEDSAFITPDGNTIYFFFTPDPNIPAEKQLTDGVTGIYRSQKVGGVWQTAERVLLQDKDDVSLDGCVLVQGDQMWFCSARKGNYRGVDMWIADLKNNKWTIWHF